MDGESRSASGRSRRKSCRFNKALCIRRYIGWSNRAGFGRSGESRKTIAAQSTTRLLQMARSICANSRRSGTGCPAQLIWYWRRVKQGPASMRLYYKFPLRLRSVFRKQVVDQDLEDEIQFHLQRQTDEYVAQGMNPEEARYAALRSMGRLQQAKEECREMRNVNFLENIGQDLHFGLRMMRRSPGFALLALLCLTLGIGANAAVFSWIEGVLLRPFPMVVHQERMMAVTGTDRATPGH